MSFIKLDIKPEYQTDTLDPPNKFFASAIPLSSLYRRASGYFSSLVYDIFKSEIFRFEILEIENMEFWNLLILSPGGLRKLRIARIDP